MTLQPIRRFGFDGAILFSDILMIPFALGQDLRFEAGEGPRLSPPLVDASLAALTPVPERFEPVYRTVEKVPRLSPERHDLPRLRGQSLDRRDLHDRRPGKPRAGRGAALRLSRSRAFQEIVDAIDALPIDYLSGQIEAASKPCNCSTAGPAAFLPAQFERWVIAPTARIVAALKARHPDVPIIGFPKGAGGKLRPMRARPASMRSGSTRRSILSGRRARRRICRSRAISTRSR